MSNSGNAFKNEAIREIDASSITTSYQDLGPPVSHRAYIITVYNYTNGQVYLRRTSDPTGVNTKRFPPTTARISDYKTDDGIEDDGTQYQVKWAGSAPGSPSGTFWIEVEYV